MGFGLVDGLQLDLIMLIGLVVYVDELLSSLFLKNVELDLILDFLMFLR